jgi:hypothetical protein
VLTPRILHRKRNVRQHAYAVAGNLIVEGWVTDIALALIDGLEATQRQHEVQGHVAEIGVHHGRLFLDLALLRRPGERALAIDVFEDQHLNVDGSGRGDREIFERNIRRHVGSSDGIVIEKGDSSLLTGERVKELVGGPIRLFSIDGGHTADLTFADLRTATAALAPGGVIVLDDVYNEIFPAVAEGTNDFMRSEHPGDLVPFVIGGNKTLFTQREWVETYRKSVAITITKMQLYRLDHHLWGEPVICLQKFPMHKRTVQYARLARVSGKRRLGIR